MLLTDKEDILKQWTLHFSTLLNQTSEVTNEALESFQQRPMIPELDAPPNTAEVDVAIKQLQTGCFNNGINTVHERKLHRPQIKD